MRKIYILVLFFVHQVSAINIQLLNARYQLDYNTVNNSFDLKELKSNVTRNFTAGFSVVYKSSKPSIRLSPITENFNYKTVAFRGNSTDSLNLFSTNAGGFTVRGTPTSATESNGIISLVFQDNVNYQLTARIYLPSGYEEPVVESSLKSLVAGYFSVGYSGAPELNRTEIKELFQPLPFTGLRVPSTSYLTPAFLCTLPGTFLTAGDQTYGVFADPAEFPFNPLPCSLARSPFGVSLRNRSTATKELKPMIWAPIIGNADSYLAANAVRSFKFRPYLTMGTMTTAYEDIARREFGFGNFRHNDLGSLNKAMHRMIDYGMSTEWGVFKEEMKGCSYDTDVPNSVKNTSALPMYAAAFIADRADIYEKRALPVLEFMLSRENTMYSPTDTSGAGGQVATNILGNPCMNYSEMLSFYNITNKQMGAMLTLANANKKGSLISNEITLKENFSLYRATQQPNVLTDLMSGVNKYIAEEITVKPTDFLFINHQQNSFWTSIAPKFVELYESYVVSGDQTYLQAARNAARIYAYHIWMAPKFGMNDSVLCNIGSKAPVYRGVGAISVPQEKAPAWRLSEMGLHCEAGGTSATGHRAIYAANYAGYLLRIGSLTKDSFLLDIAKAAVIGRYTNFPGYHMNTDRTTVYEKTNYPLRTMSEMTSTSMHYSHIWTQINLMYDYLVSDVFARTAGAVDFPGQYVQNIVQMQNQVYMNGGKFYGDENLTLWMPKGLLETVDEELNFITAYGNGKFYIVFSNQSGKAVNTTVTINPTLLDLNGKRFSQWKQNVKIQDGSIVGNSFPVAVEPHGVTAIAVNEALIKTLFQQKLTKCTTKNKWSNYAESNIPVGASRSVLINPSDSLARLFVFSTAVKGTYTSVKLNYSIDGGVWQQIEDTDYPFEFSVDLNTASTVEYSLTIGTSTSQIYKYERIKPTATLSGWTTIKRATGAFLPIQFTGTAPYEITYSEGGANKFITGIDTSLYLLKVNPQSTTQYKLLSMKDATNTVGIATGDAKVSIVDDFVKKKVYTSTKDSHVYKAFPTINYGSDAQIELKGSSTYRHDLFFTFNIPPISLSANQRVLVSLWVNSSSRLDLPYLSTAIKATAFTGNWSESLTTWNSTPLMTNTQVLDTVGISYSSPIPGFVCLDITKFIKSGFAGDLNLKVEYCKGEEAASIYFASKEDLDVSKRPTVSIVEQVKTVDKQLSFMSDLSVFPTIFKNKIEVKGVHLPFEILLFDFTGKRMIHLHNQFSINTTALPAGIYQVIIRSLDTEIYQAKIIKNLK